MSGGRSGEAVAIIPARFGAVRFPGKPLARETGLPLVVHVLHRAGSAASIREAVVATDDPRISEAVEAAGGRAVMTREDHPNGTSRLDEAAEVLGLDDDAVVVNVQGDEPEIEPASIDAAVAALRADRGASMSTLATPIGDGRDLMNPNIVKVVRSVAGRAMYFSRAPIPHHRDGGGGSGAGGDAPPLRHIGLYAYRRAFLRRYVSWSPTPLERAESLEQLRVLEHGEAIAVALAEGGPPGVDTPEQYAAFVERWRGARR